MEVGNMYQVFIVIFVATMIYGYFKGKIGKNYKQFIGLFIISSVVSVALTVAITLLVLFVNLLEYLF